jgi:hypothetical protein
MKTTTLLVCSILCITLLPLCKAHMSLIFPPPRLPAYDFLDNVRTQGPCGVPKSPNGTVTTLKAGSSFDVRFRLAYPHRGGFSVRLLDQNGTVLHYLLPHNSTQLVHDTDGTTQTARVSLPNGFMCEDGCIIQVLRHAAEWFVSANIPYLFWSCADVTIVTGTHDRKLYVCVHSLLPMQVSMNPLEIVITLCNQLS